MRRSKTAGESCRQDENRAGAGVRERKTVGESHRQDENRVGAGVKERETAVGKDSGINLELDKLLFFDGKEKALELYEEFERKQLQRFGSENVNIRVQKTQITYSNRHVFACVSMARVRKAKDLPKEYIVITFGLGYQKLSPRIDVATEPYPNRWTHHVLVSEPEEIDEELMDWVGEAYAFSERKHRRNMDGVKEAMDSVRKATDSVRKETNSARRAADRARKETDSVRRETDSVRREMDSVRKETDSMRKETDSMRKATDSMRREMDSVRKETDSARRETDSMRKETDSVRKATDSVRKEMDSVRRGADREEEETGEVRKGMYRVKRVPDRTGDAERKEGNADREGADV